MSASDRQQLIEAIKRERELHDEQNKKIIELTARKETLFGYSDQLQKLIADRAARELEFINNERKYISERSIREEKEIKANFETRLQQITQEKQELERKLESESEFIAMNLRQRLTALHERTQNMRIELNTKSRNVTESLLQLSPNEIQQKKIAENHNLCLETSKKIAEAQREIEGLTIKKERLRTILDRVNQELQEKKDPILPLPVKRTPAPLPTTRDVKRRQSLKQNQFVLPAFQ